MHLFESFEHFGWQGNQMRPCPLVQGGMGKYIDQTKMKTMHQAVLVLHNSTVPHHVDVLEVIEHAQIRRDLIFLKHDCHYERGPCGSLGHGEVHLHGARQHRVILLLFVRCRSAVRLPPQSRH